MNATYQPRKPNVFLVAFLGLVIAAASLKILAVLVALA